jgi:hypothetical protein
MIAKRCNGRGIEGTDARIQAHTEAFAAAMYTCV